MDWYEQDVQGLEWARKNLILPECPAVFYGSSSIRLWDTLARDLRSKNAVNAGFGGSTLEACVHFFERIVPPLKPASLVVYAGDNDLGDGRQPEQVVGYFRSLAAIVDRRLPGIPFGFMSIKPSVARWGIIDGISQTNRAIQREIVRHPNAYYIDIFSAMLSAKGEPRPELFAEDGLHLSAEGYSVWTSRLERWRHRIVTECSSKSKSHSLTS